MPDATAMPSVARLLPATRILSSLNFVRVPLGGEHRDQRRVFDSCQEIYTAVKKTLNECPDASFCATQFSGTGLAIVTSHDG